MYSIVTQSKVKAPDLNNFYIYVFYLIFPTHHIFVSFRFRDVVMYSNVIDV
jgi:hypothetical protein